MAPTTRNQLKATLYLLSALGTYHTWGRTVLDGSLSHLLTALHGPNLPYILPGTESPLRTRITGIVWPIDYLLDMLLVFFWEAVDGSHPATSAIGIYFLAQYLSVLTGIYVDSARRSQSGRTTIPIGTTLWLLLFQLSAIACTGPFWAFWYLANSPLVTYDNAIPPSFEELRIQSSAPPRRIMLVLPSLILGYLLPAVAMALPSPGVVSNDFQQLALVAWNLFPALVYVSMQVFHYVLLLAGGDGEKYATTASTRRTTLRIVYAVSLWISFAVHMGLLSISLTTVLFPTLWAPETLDDFHPARLLIPPVAVTPTRTVGDGVLSFFLWDQLFGYIVGILVAWSQLRTVLVARGWYHQRWAGTKVLVGIVGGVLIAGPGSVCLGLNWVRDELLMLPTTDTTVAKGNRKEE
ncbi:hypothetical protein ARAM_001878 [Aspergillus rambellii]|uniref:Aflatrem synthesis protein A n=2 Tax=Aspergillus subgen. Nidulantes TaxID=2720870 RepID=A0A0F8TZU3_9EURO|nr:hypothetical protein ARAM_001878 [Aspergillus rambellii]KKK13569.1 hypothetical protein AOCH_001037 [Aspergillus ochraceoroseus]